MWFTPEMKVHKVGSKICELVRTTLALAYVLYRLSVTWSQLQINE